MSEQNANTVTLQTYADKLDAYIATTPEIINEAEYPWIGQSLRLIPDMSKVLELGSGAGRNATYITECGYSLECTDAVQGFVDVMRQKGLHASVLDVLKDDLGAGYNMVFANGLLVHFTPQETAHVLAKVYTALVDGGIFAFSIKLGEGQKWTSEKLDAPRYFYLWQPADVRMLAEQHGFEIVSETSGTTSLKNASWLYVIARKVTHEDNNIRQ